MAEDIRTKVAEFEKQRMTLMNVSVQRQQLQALLNGLGKSLTELENTKETTVYKAAGNILVLRDKKEVEKELKDQKESQELRLKTLEKQEKSLVEKLNVLKSQIEASAAPAPEQEKAPAPDGTVITSDKK
jgi:prefoldin beta subunit